MLEESEERHCINNSPFKLQLRKSSENITNNFNESTKNMDLESRNTPSKRHNMFGRLEDGGERYLREGAMLPPIAPMSGTKYYVNLHPLESDFSSSVNSGDTCWEFVDYDDLESPTYSTPKTDPASVQIEEKVHLDTTFPITEKIKRERRINMKLLEDEKRMQLVADLEKQMVSLYNIKRQYKRNLYRESCQKDGVRLPPVKDGDKLRRQRDLIIERIKRKQIEEDKRKQKQIERKINILKTLLTEQRKREQSEKFVKFQDFRNNYDSKENEIVGVHKLSLTAQEKLSKDMVRELGQNKVMTDNLGSKPETIDVIVNRKENDNEVDGDDKLESETLTTSREKNSKRKSTILSENKVKKKEKEMGKKKKQASSRNEVTAAISEKVPEPQTSQMEGLLLWFENWRENHDGDIYRKKYMDSQKLPTEENVFLKPASVVFKDVRAGQVSRQVVEVRNTGQAPLQCRVVAVTIDNTATTSLQAKLEGPSKARSGQHWTLALTLEASELLDDTKLEVWLEFCRQGQRTQRKLTVETVAPRAHPTIGTACIRFGPHVFWTLNPVTKQLRISNPGSMGCVLRWEELEMSPVAVPGSSEDPTDQQDNDSPTANDYARTPGDPIRSEALLVARTMTELAFDRVFRVFTVDCSQNTEVPPHSVLTVPILFRPAMTSDRGDVFTKYRFTFHGKRVHNGEQDLVVCGFIEDSLVALQPSLLDMQVCYLGGTVQQGLFEVVNSARHACSVSTRVPRVLAECVSVRPKESVVQAQSSTTFAVRIILSWDFSESPCRYLDRNSGLLSFPILVTTHCPGTQPAPPLELSLVALVAAPSPLSISPSIIELGQVSTQETVSALVKITNHLSLPYDFAFVNLPQVVQVEPCGGVGTILPDESLELRVLYSPTVIDQDVRCGRPGQQSETTLVLRCFTTVSLASTPPTKKAVLNRTDEIKYTVRSVSSGYSKSTNVSEFENVEADILMDLEANDNLDLARNGQNDFEDDRILEDCSANLKEDARDKTSIHTFYSEDSISEKSEDDLWSYYSSFHLSNDNNARKTLLDGVEGDNLDPTLLGHDEQQKDGKSDFDDKSVKFTSETKLSPETVLTTRNRCEEVPVQNQRFASLVLHAVVVDPLVELSSQTVVLPPTPCTSYSMAHVYIRSRPQKKCNIHRRITTFKTWYEFRSPSAHLQVEPRTGCIQYNQNIKIRIIFRPTLNQKQIYDKALEIKVEHLKCLKVQELLEQYYKAKDRKGGKTSSVKGKKSIGQDSLTDEGKSRKGTKSTVTKSVKGKNKSKPSVVSTKTKKTKFSVKTAKTLKKKDSGPLADVTIDPSTVEVTDDDLRAAEDWLLKYWEEGTRTETVRCQLETVISPDCGESKRLESLELQVVCTTVPPTIVLSSPPCLEFGPTAIGARSKLTAQLTNISFFDASIVLSTLNPVGHFSCTAALERPLSINKEGIGLPPEHILKLPILFCPTAEGKMVERLEVTSSSTVVPLQLSGEGVLPSYRILPDQEVFSVVCASGKKVDITQSITNTCKAPLAFSLNQVFFKKGRALSIPIPSPASPSSGKKTVKSTKKEKKKVQRQFDSLTPELLHCLNNDFVDASEETFKEPVFKLMDIKSFEVLPEETKVITVRFTPPQYLKRSKKGDSSRIIEQNDTSKTGSGDNKNQFPKTIKSMNKKLKSGKGVKDKNEVQQKNNLVKAKSNEDEIENFYNIFVVKYELTFADVKKVKEFTILGNTKRK